MKAVKTKRELNREVKIANILKAARELIEEAGEDAVSLRKLARKTGLAPNTIYAHFDNSRENLIKAIIMDALADVGDSGRKALSLTKPGATPWEAAVDQFIDNPEYYRAVTLFRTDEEPLKDAEPHLQLLSSKARLLLEQAVADGLLKKNCDLDFLAAYFIHVFRSSAHRWARNEVSDHQFRRGVIVGIYTALYFDATRKGEQVFREFLETSMANMAKSTK